MVEMTYSSNLTFYETIKFPEQSEMKLASRIIPIAQRIGAGLITTKYPLVEVQLYLISR